MATIRGFVEQIDVGRAGLVTIGLVEGDGSRSSYVITDLDGDPERFNERLSKLAVARDAMNRAEPVEIDHSKGDAGEEIDRIARISRDALDPPSGIDLVRGLVVAILLSSQNALEGAGEAHDSARVFVLNLTGAVDSLRLDMQAPERLVRSDQLAMIRDLQRTGTLAQFVVSSPEKERGEPDIVAVLSGEVLARDEAGETISCFVESLGTITAPGAPASLGSTTVTTAPEFSGVGGSVDPAPFTPATLALFVARDSDPYQLVETGLTSNVRMRLTYLPLQQDSGGKETGGKGSDGKESTPSRGRVKFRKGTDADTLAERYSSVVEIGPPRKAGDSPEALLVAAELLAPLASASRPVWLRIDREMLDRGPDADCTPDLPSSSLQPAGLRDLRIPYPAEWRGNGCFNHGVYRFQLVAPEGTVLRVDCEDVCLYDSGDESGTVVGYACLEGDHDVVVVIPAYTCDTEFQLDVYRIR